MITGIFGAPVSYELDDLTGNAYLKLKDICEAIPVGWEGQYDKVRKDKHGRYWVSMQTFTANDGKKYRSVAIPAHHLMNFLDDINLNKLTSEQAHRLDRLKLKLRNQDITSML